MLKTDTQNDIDLSGRWNDTDAEIASSELYSSLLGSAWLQAYQAETNLQPRIAIQSFEYNFKYEEEWVSQYFIKYINKDSSFEMIMEKGEKLPDFQLIGEINAEEFMTESQKYIDYRLTVQLRNMNGEILWGDKTVIKKYIKD
jgi:hypothetical protein